MTQIVVDASVAVKWLVDEPQADAARRLLDARFELHVPRLMAIEVANALRRKVQKGEVEASEATARIGFVHEGPLYWADDEEIASDALRIALAISHPIYDCIYLALAHRLGARVVTADMRFMRRVAPTAHGGAIVGLADYAAE